MGHVFQGTQVNPFVMAKLPVGHVTRPPSPPSPPRRAGAGAGAGATAERREEVEVEVEVEEEVEEAPGRGDRFPEVG